MFKFQHCLVYECERSISQHFLLLVLTQVTLFPLVEADSDWAQTQFKVFELPSLGAVQGRCSGNQFQDDSYVIYIITIELK